MKRIVGIVCFCSLGCALWGGLLNGNFEIIDPNITEWFIPPLYWHRVGDNPYGDCYAAVRRFLVPSPQYDRSKQQVDWMIPAAYEGKRFVVLSTGDLGEESDPAIIHSTIYQTVTFLPGQKIAGAFFFGTCDYLPYNDYGQIYLLPVDHNIGLPSEIVLAYADVIMVQDFQSTRRLGFPSNIPSRKKPPAHTTSSAPSEDNQDTIYKSYLAVDGLYICTPQPGDINSGSASWMLSIFRFSHGPG
jgi:hypothetical protein